MSTRKKQFDSMTGILKDLDKDGPPPVPDGFKFRGWELQFWSVITGVRPNSDWRRLDLVVLAKVVVLERRIREMTMQMELEGLLLVNRFGAVSANPLDGMLRQTQKQQLSLLQSISALASPMAGPEKKQSAQKALNKEHTETRLEDHDIDLLPRA